MSQKNAKQERAAEKAALKEDLVKQLEAARASQADRLEQSMAHLAGQLDMAYEKYLTVNGFMQARTTYEQASFGNITNHPAAAKSAADIAREMSDLAGVLAEKVREITAADLTTSFLDGYLNPAFVNGSEFHAPDITRELLIANLLQNVGPSIDDIVNFRDSTNEGIATLEAELAKLEEAPELTSVQ